MSIRISVGARKVALALGLAIVGSAGCHEGASASDRERLAALEREFGSKYTFALDRELYVRVVARNTGAHTRSDMEKVYRTFMHDETGARRNTTFVYINVYDPPETFVYQLAFDPLRGEFVTSNTEHY